MKPCVIKKAALMVLCIGICFCCQMDGFRMSVSAEKSQEQSGTARAVRESVGTEELPGYDAFLEKYKEYSNGDLPEAVFSVVPSASKGIREVRSYKETEANGYYTDSESKIVLEADIKKAGLYALSFTYIAERERGASIRRDLLINGEKQHEGCNELLFGRLYADKPDEIGLTDRAGNEIRPSQVEIQAVQTVMAVSSQGIYRDPFLYYMKKGKNKIELVGISEPMVLVEAKAGSIRNIPDYQTYKENIGSKQKADRDPILIEAEKATYKSTPTLYGKFDRTSPTTSPYDSERQLLNMIGGSTWNKTGQYGIWEFEVPVSGLYSFHLKVRKNENRDFQAARAIYIDGEIPFKELEAWEFGYSDKWQNVTLADEDGRPFEIYLEKGVHELKIQATMGSVMEQSKKVQGILKELNAIYTDILVITGSSPDTMRDYRLGSIIPNLSGRMSDAADRLQEIKTWMDGYSKRGQNAAALDVSIRQLRKMADDTDLVPKELDFFKSNNGNLATWLIQSRNQALEMDYIMVTSRESEKLVDANPGFFQNMAFAVGNFFKSFRQKSQSIGGDYKGEAQSVKVWIPSGRDQAQVLRKLIDQYFTPKTGIYVDLQLVTAASLLPATVADNGPDVALNIGDTEPVNYAIRDAVIDLTQFSDFEEVSRRFMKERMVPLTFEEGVYALPETQNFNMLFYRTDILKNLGIEVPQTWTDVIATVPLLLKNNMNLGLPVSVPRGDLIEAGTSTFYTMLFQRGGEIYRDHGMETNLNGLIGQEAFNQWTNLYVNYSLPREYDFLTTFRTGENPIIMGNFANYNTLMVSAPEIQGEWAFTMIPGTRKEDGTIDRSTPLSGVNCIILKKHGGNEKYKAAWEFLKWWTDAPTQVSFGQEMESILGESARYATANVEGFSQIAWDSDFYKVLKQQMEWGKGIEQVPGGYYMGRHLNNAFRKVVISKEDVRETLLDYAYVINQELVGKRKEFDLPVPEDWE